MSEEAGRTVRAAMAALAWFVGVCFPVLAVNYALGGGGGGLLQVLGAAHVDAAALYMLLCGWLAAATEAQPPRTVLRAVLPDTALSGALHLVLQAVHGTASACDWANVALAPLLLSAFTDMREANVLRGPSETAWLVHAQTLLVLASGSICVRLRGATLSSALRTVLFAWMASAVHVYVAYVHPQLVTTAARNVVTCASMFSVGALVGLLSVGAFEWGTSAREWLAAVPVRVGYTAAAAVAMVYLLHLSEAPSTAGVCVSVFGGAPCLWPTDAFNGRLLPLFVLALAWVTGPAEPWLGGPLGAPLSDSLQHVSTALAACVDDGHVKTWLLYGGLFALALHAPVAAVAGSARFTCLWVPIELAFVTLLTGVVRAATEARLAAAFDYAWPVALTQYQVAEESTRFVIDDDDAPNKPAAGI
jgi:hypothetical protein